MRLVGLVGTKVIFIPKMELEMQGRRKTFETTEEAEGMKDRVIARDPTPASQNRACWGPGDRVIG